MTKHNSLANTQISAGNAVPSSTTAKNQSIIAEFFGAMLKQPVEILDINLTGENGLEDPSFRFCQMIVTRPDGTRSRLEVGTIQGSIYFEVIDEEWD
jgi:hypothetical protein